MSEIPLTSAPALKKRPAPVRTVKTVSGWSFRTRRASMVSWMRLPPKELRALGRLNWGVGLVWWRFGFWREEGGI